MAFNSGGQLSTQAQQDLLNFYLRAQAITAPTTCYVGLSTATPTAPDGTGLAEPTSGTGGYARVEIGGGVLVVGDFAAPTASGSGQVLTNAVAVAFAASSAAWSTGATALTWFSLWKTLTGTTASNFMGAGPLTPNTNIVNGAGVTISFAIGALSLTIT